MPMVAQRRAPRAPAAWSVHEIAAFVAERPRSLRAGAAAARRRAEELHTRSLEDQRALTPPRPSSTAEAGGRGPRALRRADDRHRQPRPAQPAVGDPAERGAPARGEPLTAQQAGRVEAILRATGRSTRLIGDLLDFTQARARRRPAHPAERRSICTACSPRPSTTCARRTRGASSSTRSRAPATCIADADRLGPAARQPRLERDDLRRPAAHRDRPLGDRRRAAYDRGAQPRPGHPGRALPGLFEPMTRGRRERRAQGVGLGLFIVREIARAHGGSASARSSAAEGEDDHRRSAGRDRPALSAAGAPASRRRLRPAGAPGRQPGVRRAGSSRASTSAKSSKRFHFGIGGV